MIRVNARSSGVAAFSIVSTKPRSSWSSESVYVLFPLPFVSNRWARSEDPSGSYASAVIAEVRGRAASGTRATNAAAGAR